MKSRLFYAALATMSSLTLLSTGPASAQERPERPETPATPEKPETPVVPDKKPDTPAVPEHPETPVVPDNKPDTPAAPEKPETPVVPDKRPEKPAEPEPGIQVTALDAEGDLSEGEIEAPEVEVENPDVDQPAKPSKDDLADKAQNDHRPDFVDTLKSARENYNEGRKILREALKADLAALGDEATKEQIEEVVNKFREMNAELIASQKTAAEAIKLAAKEMMSVNAPAHVLEIRQTLHAANDERKAARDAFKAALANAETAEDKKALVEAFRTEQRDQHKQLKDELKKLREETRNAANDGDRRLDE